MAKSPLVSFIILNYNGGKITERCLNSVLKCDYPRFEVILIDNGSEEEEKKRLEDIYEGKIKLVFNKKNLGYAAGNNLGAHLAKGKYLVFLNNDTLVPSDLLKKTITKMAGNRKIAFLQPKIKWLKYKHFFEYAGGAGGTIDYFGYPFVRGRIFGSIEEDVGQFNDERDIFWASGVALFCRKKTFEKLGGFDPLFFAYSEETDLCFRAHRAGYRVYYCPKTEVLHFGGYTSNRNIPQKTFLIHRNHLILLLKNLKAREILFIFPFRLIMDLGSMLYYLISFRSATAAFTVVTAYLSLVKNFSKILRTRRNYKIKTYGYPSSRKLVYRGSIVWQYFFLGKRRWNEIFGIKGAEGTIIGIF